MEQSQIIYLILTSLIGTVVYFMQQQLNEYRKTRELVMDIKESMAVFNMRLELMDKLYNAEFKRINNTLDELKSNVQAYN